MKQYKAEAMDILKTMSIEELVGQLFILAFPKKDPNIIADITDQYGIAGCYISQDNASTFSEAQTLTRALQERYRQAHSMHTKDLPLLLGVDQEGAWGVLVPESTIGPGNLALGTADTVEDTAAMYGIFAREMRSVGYTAILGPCADINLDPLNPIIGTRSFGEDASRVATHVVAAVKAIQAEGILACAKHFPGHGDTHADTHRDIPQVDKSMNVLKAEELFPFQMAIDAGVDMIMTSHILFPQIDSEHPATLSHRILTRLLRDTMHFQGLIITDSMNMGAIRKHYSPEQASIQAFQAGADLIMLSEEHYDHSSDYKDKQIASINSIIDAVEQGILARELLAEKVCRILQKKLELKERLAARSKSPIQRSMHQECERTVSRHAIHILRDRTNLLPLTQEQSIALINATPRTSYHNLMNIRGIGPNQATPAFDSFTETFQQLHPNLTVYHYEDISSEENLQTVMDPYDILIVVTEDYPLPGEDFEKTAQQHMVKRFISLYNNKIILLGLRSPYEISMYPDLNCYISTYSSRTCAAIAAATMLGEHVRQ